jgi:cell division protein FtsL
MRVVNLFLLFTIITVFAVLYHIRYGAEAEVQAIRKADRAIAAEQMTRQILQAEWTSLNDPARLEILARRHLKLDPVTASQILTRETLPQAGEDKLFAISLPVSPVVIEGGRE